MPQTQLLGDQQMPGAGDRQELGDALDEAEQDDANQVTHVMQTFDEAARAACQKRLAYVFKPGSEGRSGAPALGWPPGGVATMARVFANAHAVRALS